MSESTNVKGAGAPAFVEPHYIDGYDPVSYYAPHSSLRHTSTWLGMGMVLSSVIGFGTFVFGFSAGRVSLDDGVGVQFLNTSAQQIAVIGIITALVLLLGGFAMIHYGRRDYRAYRARTGRVN